ncbi:hypothetical protein D9X30_1815 [Cupriavidus sp. U2]|nr:hypothetical protein D9X30_1815 [Cupriavidus sp. U2]
MAIDQAVSDMNSKQRRKAYRNSPFQIETTWTFRGAPVTITRVASPTAVIVEFEGAGARTHVPTRALEPRSYRGATGGSAGVSVGNTHPIAVEEHAS